MRITFFGGAGEVGRSCVLVEEEDEHLLLDCGIKLGEEEAHPIIERRDLMRIRRIAISHSHLDHIGFLLHAFARGCRARVWATKPTRDTMQLLFADYLRLRRRPSLTHEHADKVLRHTEIVEYGEEVGEGALRFTFHEAGHILGSAQVRVQGSSTLLYTGDVNTRETKLLRPAERGLAADTLIMECTYGRRSDSLPSVRVASARLAESINRTIAEGGSVLIPSFAVGRGQEVLLALDAYMAGGLLRKVPIYVDGLILRANRLYRHNILWAREELQRSILVSEYDPFKSPFFKKKTGRGMPREQCIIVSTAGMLTGGPALGYLKAMAGDPRNRLIFVGYQAEGTLGRKILDGAREVYVGGERIAIRLQVENISFSAHADHRGLLELARSVRGLKRIFLVHGEPPALREMAEVLSREYEVVVPKNGEIFEL
ncbi:MAG: MBL fold metallo-hydrolase RNA specificity domain-containing protein [Candidatus Micrarchaeia archaeon]